LEWFPPPPEADKVQVNAAAFRVAEVVNLIRARILAESKQGGRVSARRKR
jgi:hypothetical protein